MPVGLQIYGHFSTPSATASGTTPFSLGIPPYPGPVGQAPIPYTYTLASGSKGTAKSLGLANWNSFAGGGGALTIITRLKHTTGTTAKNPCILRPLNFTTVTTAVAKGGTVINLTDDPGIYSTNYRFPSNLGYPASVADNGIANTDYFAVQLADGTWNFGLVTSVATLAITVPALPSNTTGAGGILAGAIFFFYGQQSDVDPATGQAHPAWYTTVTATETETEGNVGLFSSLRPGEPLIFRTANGSDASFVGAISGVYAKY